MFSINNILNKSRRKLLSILENDSFTSSVYGKVYYPVYNKSAQFDTYLPEIYSKSGNRLKLVYTRNFNNAHSPYTNSEYIYFDRFNFGLDTHLYSHDEMLKQIGNPNYKFGSLQESEAIVPEDYKIFDKYSGLYKDFDYIFTHSYEILNKIPNAKYVPFCANPWYATERGGGILDPKLYEKKTKMISILSSNLTMCDMHRRRLQCAMDCKSRKLADTFGTFDNGPTVKIADTLTEYRYSIAIENDIKPYWFTERITSCFASFTVPVYCGASKISDFFNPDGIIFITPEDCLNIDKVLQQCTEKDYESRIPAMIENYNKVMSFYNVTDYMYLKYMKPLGV